VSVGDRAPHPRAVDAVTGRTRFADDHTRPGMLFARLVRSPHAHARVVAIDAAPALSLPGVHAVITAKDLPGRFGVIPWTQDEQARQTPVRGQGAGARRRQPNPHQHLVGCAHRFSRGVAGEEALHREPPHAAHRHQLQRCLESTPFEPAEQGEAGAEPAVLAQEARPAVRWRTAAA
jgi:hypothetical protein